KEVSIELNRRAFAFYDVTQRDWIVEAGDFEILVGASSRDIRLTAALRLDSEQKASLPADRERLAAYYNFPKGASVSQKDFEALLGQPVPANAPPPKGNYTLNTPLSDMDDSFIGRQFFNMLNGQVRKILKEQEDTPNALMMTSIMKDMPLRGLLMMGGPLDRPKLEALLLMINGKGLRGFGALVKSLVRK
ncbi:MAG TPA: fibronectin type III-like domain-contianing protein, partial [Anaerolineales bacterium]|nr:fibronectin type III-like domain-contianing protein [Anaerolineales bacterium]